MDLIKRILGSRKWVAALVGFLLPIANEKFGWNLSQDAVITCVASIAAVIFGESFVDAKAAENGGPKPKKK